MADDLNAFTGMAETSLFSGKPRDENSIFPRARIRFRSLATVIPLKMAGDTAINRLILTLPPNYAYALDGFTYTINTSAVVGDMTQMANLGQFNLQFSDPGNANDAVSNFKSEGVSQWQSNAGEFKTWSLLNPYQEVFFAPRGGSPVIQVWSFNDDGTNAAAAMVLLFNITFLQYDIRQVDKVSVNAPQPVKSR